MSGAYSMFRIEFSHWTGYAYNSWETRGHIDVRLLGENEAEISGLAVIGRTPRKVRIEITESGVTIHSMSDLTATEPACCLYSFTICPKDDCWQITDSFPEFSQIRHHPSDPTRQLQNEGVNVTITDGSGP